MNLAYQNVSKVQMSTPSTDEYKERLEVADALRKDKAPEGFFKRQTGCDDGLVLTGRLTLQNCYVVAF